MILSALVIYSLFASGTNEIKAAQPTALYDQEGNVLPNVPSDPRVNWEVMRNQNGVNNVWKGVAQVTLNGGPECTATLIKVPNCPNPNKAQMITNGHCTQKNGNYGVRFGAFEDTPANEKHDVRMSELLYSSRDFYDLAIMEVDTSYQALARLGIQPMEIAQTPINSTAPLRTVGVPLNGLEKHEQVMRTSVCRQKGPVTLVDGTNMWRNDIALDQCSLTGGASGSGLFNDGKMYGLVHAGAVNEAFGNKACVIDSCVYDGRSEPKRNLDNYGFDVTFLHKCYENCRINTKRPGCPLPDPDKRITISHAPHPHWMTDLNRRIQLSSHFPSYQVKGCQARQSQCNCESNSGYTALNAQSVVPANYFPASSHPQVTPGGPPAFQYLCIRGVNADGSVEPAKNTLHVPVYVYKEAPSQLPKPGGVLPP